MTKRKAYRYAFTGGGLLGVFLAAVFAPDLPSAIVAIAGCLVGAAYAATALTTDGLAPLASDTQFVPDDRTFGAH